MSILLANANALAIPLADESVQMVVTSPPYFGLRDYGIPGQIGLESNVDEYVKIMVSVFREVARVLRDDGVVFLNLGDSYAGSGGAGGDYDEGGLREGQPRYKSNFEIDKSKRKNGRWGGGNIPAAGNLKPKDLIGVPWRVAFALQADGWYLRSDIIWSKPNPMPESVTDRPTKAHEYMFLLAKSERYYYDADAIREPHKEASIERAKHEFHPKKLALARSDHLNMGFVEKGMEQALHQNGRNKRTVWTIATAPYSGAHFATYPPALVEPCIKAGTSEAGGCSKCGKPWERVTEIERTNYKVFDHPHRTGNLMSGGVGKNFPDAIRNHKGFRPACSCSAPARPCIILDPFAGSGTSLVVARALGRSAIGLDLSFAYLHDQARARLSLDAQDDWVNGNGKQAAGELSDLPMFEQP